MRAHEQVQIAAAGGHATGGIQLEFGRGPDSQQYAVAGHVAIDTAPVAGDPAKPFIKAQTVRRADLAPGDPPGADRKVGSKATRTLNAAQAELAAEARNDTEGAGETKGARETMGTEETETAEAAASSEESATKGASVRASYVIVSYAQAA